MQNLDRLDILIERSFRFDIIYDGWLLLRDRTHLHFCFAEHRAHLSPLTEATDNFLGYNRTINHLYKNREITPKERKPELLRLYVM